MTRIDLDRMMSLALSEGGIQAMYAVGFLVDRMHVCAPYLDIARMIYRRCRRAGLDRAARKLCIAAALRRHHDNRTTVARFHL